MGGDVLEVATSTRAAGGRGARRTAAVVWTVALVTGLLTAGGGVFATVQSSCTPGLANIAQQPASGYIYERGSIRSFDCTPIVFNLFEPTDASPAHPVYTILEGPGWGGAGSTTPDSQFIANDYAELTWDPRGFGQSGGRAEVDSPDAEGKDVSALISYVLDRPEIQKDTRGVSPDYSAGNTYGEPAVGMTGVSYGGGIEFATAAFDDRVKAMVPGWAWNNLDYSLFPGGVLKLGWDELLFGVGLAEIAATHGQGNVQGLPAGKVGGTAGVQTGGFDPNIYAAEAKGLALGYPDQATLSWFAQRSMAVYGQNGHVPDVPTLLVQGTVDTLFNVNEAWANHDEMEAAHPGLPVKLIAFCGGHVSCPTGAAPQGIGYQDTSGPGSVIAPDTSASDYTEAQTIKWFDVYLRGRDKNGNVVRDTQPEVVYQDQKGDFWPASTFPTVSDPGPAFYDVVPVKGQLLSTGVPTGFGPAGEAAVVTDGASAANDPGAVTIPVVEAKKSDVMIVGEPHISASVQVQGTSTDLFFRLVDEATGKVVDLQTAAVRIDNVAGTGQGGLLAAATKPVTVSLDMVGVAYDLPAGDTLELQVATSGPSFVPNRGAAVVTFDGHVSIPTM